MGPFVVQPSHAHVVTSGRIYAGRTAQERTGRENRVAMTDEVRKVDAAIRPLARLSAVAALAFVALAILGVAAGPAAGASRCGERPWCDTALSPDRRAELLVAKMTLDEKLALLTGSPTQAYNTRLVGVPRLGFPPVLIADGPAGISRPEDGQGFALPGKGRALAMPAPVALAASFDSDVARAYASTVAREARDRGIDVILGPAMDIVRSPRAGRAFETLSGEDPLLGSRLGASWIRGAQAQGLIADAKHFTAYNQETDRFGPNAVDAQVGQRALREIYLPAFEAAVRAGVGTFMSAYNRVNGSYMDQNEPLLRDVLKREWRFRGAVISDFDAGVHGTGSSLRAGLDVELPRPQFLAPARVRAALEAGELNLADIDDAVSRTLRTLFAFGVPDRSAFRNRGPAATTPKRRGTARRVAERGIVLLKNRHRVLPLDDAKLGSLAVIGGTADAYEAGGGSSHVDPVTSVSPLEGLRRRAGGGVEIRTAGDDPAAAATAARGADAAVVVLGDDSAEFSDKTGLGLTDGSPTCAGGRLTPFGNCGAPATPNSDALVRAVAAANPNTIVVLETAGPVLVPWAGRVRALVEAWYPGQQGGDAIARVLFGDVDAAGRLPVTWPRRAADLAVRTERQFPGVPGPAGNRMARYSEGIFVGYRWFDRRGLRPLFPFGHGLSYTSFSYRSLRIRRFGARGTRVSLLVKNTGRRTGIAAPQLYLGLPNRPGLPQPPRRLAAFTRVAVRPRAARRVAFDLDGRAFSSWDESRRRWTRVPGCTRVEVGESSRDVRLRGAVAVKARASTCAEQ